MAGISLFLLYSYCTVKIYNTDNFKRRRKRLTKEASNMKISKKPFFKITLAIIALLAAKLLFFSKNSPCAIHIGEYRDEDW